MADNVYTYINGTLAGTSTNPPVGVGFRDIVGKQSVTGWGWFYTDQMMASDRLTLAPSTDPQRIPGQRTSLKAVVNGSVPIGPCTMTRTGTKVTVTCANHGQGLHWRPIIWNSPVSFYNDQLYIESITNANQFVFDCGTNTPANDTSGTAILYSEGDNPIHSSGQRNELMEMLNSSNVAIREVAGATAYYFATSVYLPTDWVDPDKHPYAWAIPFQCHADDNYVSGEGPNVSIQLLTSNSNANISVCTEGGRASDWVNPSTGLVDPSKHFQQQIQVTGGTYSDGSAQPTKADCLGKWLDICFRVVFQPDNTGSIQVWSRLNGWNNSKVLKLSSDTASPVATATLWYDQNQGSATAVQPHYWKRGLYRGPSLGTSTLYMGPVGRASNMADACWAAFGQYP